MFGDCTLLLHAESQLLLSEQRCSRVCVTIIVFQPIGMEQQSSVGGIYPHWHANNDRQCYTFTYIIHLSQLLSYLHTPTVRLHFSQAKLRIESWIRWGQLSDANGTASSPHFDICWTVPHGLHVHFVCRERGCSATFLITRCVCIITVSTILYYYTIVIIVIIIHEFHGDTSLNKTSGPQ